MDGRFSTPSLSWLGGWCQTWQEDKEETREKLELQENSCYSVLGAGYNDPKKVVAADLTNKTAKLKKKGKPKVKAKVKVKSVKIFIKRKLKKLFNFVTNNYCIMLPYSVYCLIDLFH